MSHRLQILLDAHIHHHVAHHLAARCSGIVVHALAEWKGGEYRSKSDDAILTAAHLETLTLVTYDAGTIPELLLFWYFEGRAHGGVILVDDRSIPQQNVGALVRALERLWHEEGSQDWTNRCRYLAPAP